MLNEQQQDAGEHEAGTQSHSGSHGLIVDKDGKVRSVLKAAGADGTLQDVPGHVDDIWGPEIGARVIKNVRRVLRDRCFAYDEVHEGEGGINIDFTFVPQGQESAVIVAHDISVKQSELLRMHRLAYVDETTALPNREFFLRELKDVCEFQRLKEGRIAVIVLNIGQLEESRNTFGNARQDFILAELAGRLAGALRGTNVEDADDYERRSFLARTDYHTFGIILPSIEAGADAEAVAERVIESVSEPVQVGDRSIRLRGHAGISLFPQDGRNGEALFENAVAAMEDARSSHDSSYKFHTGTMRLRTLQRQDLELELRTALDTGEFTVSYQPIIERKSGKIHTVEALLRWPDSILGAHSTRKLVSIAERTSLITEIDAWVLNQSCEQLSQWKQSGFPKLRLSLNVSSQEFSRPDLVQSLTAALLRSGIQPSDIDIEINEHILFRDAMKNYSTCRALKSIGIGVVVDDYGIGSCSLAHLSHAPIDSLKIDNVLVGNLEVSGRDNAACDAAIKLSHALGLTTIAEGVETEQQAELLGDLGCDFLQGYYYFEPMLASEIDEYLELSNRSPRPRIVKREQD